MRLVTCLWFVKYKCTKCLVTLNYEDRVFCQNGSNTILITIIALLSTFFSSILQTAEHKDFSQEYSSKSEREVPYQIFLRRKTLEEKSKASTTSQRSV